MTERTRRLSAYAAAALLATLTIGVFAPLQSYGPESAIRRFNTAILRGDPVDLQRVTEQDLNSKSVQVLGAEVRGLLHMGSSYQLLRMERQPNQVRAAVVYTLPNGQPLPMVWVVERHGRAWKVNADKTITILRDSLGV